MRYFVINIWKIFRTHEPCRSYWRSDDERIHLWLQPEHFVIIITLIDRKIDKYFTSSSVKHYFQFFSPWTSEILFISCLRIALLLVMIHWIKHILKQDIILPNRCFKQVYVRLRVCVSKCLDEHINFKFFFIYFQMFTCTMKT